VKTKYSRCCFTESWRFIT